MTRFEAAADAIVGGQFERLRAWLQSDAGLIRARSGRRHHATLLHYVGANGVEGFRQHTPRNAVEILDLLLASGVEVDAAADMHGGSTTLGLVATSRHPRAAGLQEPLIDRLPPMALASTFQAPLPPAIRSSTPARRTASPLRRRTARVVVLHSTPKEPGATAGPTETDYVVVIEALLKAGANVEPSFLEWWDKQSTTRREVHARIAELLRAGLRNR